MSDQKTTAQVWVADPQVLAGIANPQTAITIAIDTSFVLGTDGGVVSNGVYMFDNRLSNDSSSEGSLNLSTRCNVGDYIGFEVVPIDQNTGDTVSITGFQISHDSVFGSDGYPMQVGTRGNYWVGRARNASQRTTYQIQVKVTSIGLRPSVRFIQWDPYIVTN
ncbi:hypothetical protein [Pseudomonas chlororaphis]|uniref:hypothetical protein n=1 Tax=Pseudomonas chlororaphis TaxID=587753 RepID=UPI001B306BEC|nr:hypothetical protein [Pseudomonas chlororaphis]QTT89576.1 hypothetical protein HUT28_20020 [Pseudomonas chlororaphis]